jgi:hypothetical protein
MTPAALRAEPAAATATSDDCLAKPNGDAPAGSHWFYRVDRASGRRCWHVRAQDGQADSADAKAEQGESAAPRRVTTPAPAPSAAAPPEPQARSTDNGPSAALPPAPDWPAMSTPSRIAAPIAGDAAPVTNDNAAEQAPPTRAIDPQIDARAADAHFASTPPAAAPAPPMAEPVAARTATSTIDPNHIPALLGTGLVLLLIILGSIAAHFAGRVLQGRRLRRAAREAPSPSWDSSHADVETNLRTLSAPVVQMRRKDKAPDRPVAPDETAPVVAAGETAQALEENVRALLHRLRSDLKSNPQPNLNPKPSRVADVAASVPSESPPMAPAALSSADGDLEAALAIWAGNKKRVSP